MELIELPKKQWYPISGFSLDIKIPCSHNVSSTQAVSSLQCNREYVVHMFSDVPRVIMLDSGIHSQEELNNGSKCSSKLSGLGMEHFSLSQISNNIIYVKGKELSIVNIQSDNINTLIKSHIYWKKVAFNPLDDCCFIAWNENVVCLWNRSSYEYHILQSDTSSMAVSKSSHSCNNGLSSCVLVHYPEDANICKCCFIGDYIILFTSNGYYDTFPLNLSPGEYYRSLKNKSILTPNAILLDVMICPNTRFIEVSNNQKIILLAILSVVREVYKVSVYNFPIDNSHIEEEILLLQNININIIDENKSSNQYNAHFIGPNWGENIAIQIFNQLIVCSIGDELPIKGIYFFPSRLLETAAFRPPKVVTWADIGNCRTQKDRLSKQPIEIFISNIFGGLESINIPSFCTINTPSSHNSEESNSQNDLFARSLSNQTNSISTSKDDITEDYYSVLMANSSLNVDKNRLQTGNKTRNNYSSDRSDLISSLFGTLNLEDPQIESSSQNNLINTNNNFSDITDMGNTLEQLRETILQEFRTQFRDFSNEMRSLFSSKICELVAPIERDVESIKLHLSGIEVIKDENIKFLNSFSKLETSIRDYRTQINEKLDHLDSYMGKLIKDSKSINERVSKLCKTNENINNNSIDDFTQAIADSFGTLTDVVTGLQASINRLESNIHSNSFLNSSSSTNNVWSSKNSATSSVAIQIEEAFAQKQYDRAFAIAISADQAAISSRSEKDHINGECWVLNLAYKFDPCIWLDNEPLPISQPVILGISKILSDTVPYVIESFKSLSGSLQNNAIADLKLRVLWIKETIHCFEPFTDTLAPKDIIQILNEISESMNRCISLINSFSDSSKSINYSVPMCFTDGSITSEITSILRHIRRTIRNVAPNLK